MTTNSDRKWIATFSGKVVAEAASPYEMAILLKKLGRHGCIVKEAKS